MSASLAAGARQRTSSTASLHLSQATPPAPALQKHRPPAPTPGARTPAAMLRTVALLRSHRLRLVRLASLPEGAAIRGADDGTHHEALQPQIQHQQTRSAAAAAAAPLPAARAPLFPLFPPTAEKERLVLGIESSCDDTAAAVVTTSGRVLSSTSASQQEVHARWGGVVPALARHAHRAAIDGVVSRALREARVTDPASQLSAVAVTVGPGLSLCLDVGVRKARAVARAARVPLVPVHHMEAHALVARLPLAAAAASGAAAGAGAAAPPPPPTPQTTEAAGASPLPFPFLCLLVSGGHNLLVLAKGVGDYTLLGTTLDDAAGEALDKVARLLGLPAEPHGAAALERLALEGDANRYRFPPPMKKRRNCDFSYAGLKTSARMAIERELGGLGGGVEEGGGGGENENEEESAERRRVRADLAASFQRAAVEHLVERTRRGVEWAREGLLLAAATTGPFDDGGGNAAAAAATPPLPPPQHQHQLCHLVVAGGVAVNKTVRSRLLQLAQEEGLELVVPPPQWCTDNGVMVAWAGCERAALGLWQPAPDPLPPLSDEAYDQASRSAREAWEQVARQYGEEAAAGAAGAGADGRGGASGGAPPGVSREEAAALGEWVELRPRWPLTSDAAAGATGDVLSKKRADKMSPSLTDLTRRALREGGGGLAVGGGQAAAAAAVAP